MVNEKIESKTKDVLYYMKTHSSITSIEAINLFAATRLSAIIYNLRKGGYNIESKDCATRDKYGRLVHYTKYIYLGEPKYES